MKIIAYDSFKPGVTMETIKPYLREGNCEGLAPLEGRSRNWNRAFLLLHAVKHHSETASFGGLLHFKSSALDRTERPARAGGKGLSLIHI